MVEPTVVVVQRIAPERSLPNSSLLLESVQGAASVLPANMFSVYEPLVLNGCRDTVALPLISPGRTTRPRNVFLLTAISPFYPVDSQSRSWLS